MYTEVLAGKLREEMEGKGLIPENQTGFKKEKGTIDNIYVLYYLVKKYKHKRGEVNSVFFRSEVAFDTVDRGILIKTMREREIRENIVERYIKILRETNCRVKVDGMLGEGFWTERGVRQGCPLSPELFNIFLADLEEELRKRGGKKLNLKKGEYTL